MDTTSTNGTDQRLALCANACYAAATSYSTTPYYSRDTPQNVTLVYTEDRAHPRPVVYMDVSSLVAPSYYTLSATLNGTNITFLNGDTQLYFAGTNTALRLAGQFDASSNATGIYNLVTTVTATYPDGTFRSHNYTTRLTIVNEAASSVARGWTIAGLQRLYFPATNLFLITDGTGSAIEFPGLGVMAADYSTLTYNAGTGLYDRAYLDGTHAIFYGSGLLKEIVDRLGQKITFGYSGSSLSSITDAQRNTVGSGRYIGLTYGTNGISTITELGGAGARTTTFGVASDRSLQTITDPDGISTSYRYDVSGRLQYIISRRGDTTTYVYDPSSWKLKEINLPRVAVNAGGGNTVNRIPKVAYVPWQTLGVPTTHTSSTLLSAATAVSSIRATITDPIGRMTAMTPDRWGQPVKIVDPTNRVTTIQRSGVLPVRIVRPGNAIDTMAYVPGTPLISYFKLAGDSAVNYHYGVFGQVDSIWGPGTRPERRFLHGATGRVDSLRYAGAILTTVRYYYDAYNRDTLYKDASPHLFRKHYSAISGNVDTTISIGKLKTIRQFDTYGRDSIGQASGATYQTVTLYDALNRVVKTWHAGAVDDTTIITYDQLYAIRIRTAGGHVHKSTVNSLGWVTARYSPADTTVAMTYRYDTAGRVTSYTNRRGQRIDLSYDALDRLTGRSGMNLPTDTYSYDSTGRTITGARGSIAQDTLLLNASGKIDTIIRGIANHRFSIITGHVDYLTGATKDSVLISSDLGVRFEKYVNSVVPGEETYSYTTITGGTGAGMTTAKINADNLPEETVWPSGVIPSATGLTSTAGHWLNTLLYTVGTVGDSLTRKLEYDSLGRVVVEVRPTTYPSSSTQWVRRYFTYDGLGRLTKVRREKGGDCTVYIDSIFGSGERCTSTVANPFFDVTQDTSWYDAASNRSVTGATYDAMKMQLTAWPGLTYTYDADGNLLTRTHGGVTDNFYWNAINQLDSLRSGSFLVSYAYNAFGQLVRRSRNGVVDRYFLWDINNLLAELSGAGTRIAQYLYSTTDKPFALATDNGATSRIRYFSQDVLGNVNGVLGNTGLSQFTVHSAWGKIDQRSINTLADTNRLGWKALMYEGDSTKLYYVRNRWYDPEVGRFISEDPIGIAGGLNLYAFASNDPINGHDPAGLSGDSAAVLPTVPIYGNPDGSDCTEWGVFGCTNWGRDWLSFGRGASGANPPLTFKAILDKFCSLPEYALSHGVSALIGAGGPFGGFFGGVSLSYGLSSHGRILIQGSLNASSGHGAFVGAGDGFAIGKATYPNGFSSGVSNIYQVNAGIGPSVGGALTKDDGTNDYGAGISGKYGRGFGAAVTYGKQAGFTLAIPTVCQ